MPVMRPQIRVYAAIQYARHDSPRTLTRNHCVISDQRSTENATSASRQSIQSSITMMPTSVNVAEYRDHLT
jgi:hypothetical protein